VNSNISVVLVRWLYVMLLRAGRYKRDRLLRATGPGGRR